MKNKLLNFLSKYWLSILLSLIMVLGIFLSDVYADSCKFGKGYIQLNLWEFYLVFGLPVYALIYGCLSYIRLRKIWVPQLILFIVAFLFWLIYGLDAFFWSGTYIWSVYPVGFSLIASSVTKLICYIVKEIKEDLR